MERITKMTLRAILKRSAASECLNVTRMLDSPGTHWEESPRARRVRMNKVTVTVNKSGKEVRMDTTRQSDRFLPSKRRSEETIGQIRRVGIVNEPNAISHRLSL